jgi:endonuclease G, mitochondrial
MLITRDLITASEARLRKAKVQPARLDKQLGDGPLALSPDKKKQRLRTLLAQTENPTTAEIGLERIIEGNDLDSVNYLAKGTAASRPICRIQLKDLSSNLVGYATGFLVGPGVLLTNHHVFGEAPEARNSIADFDYELDIDGNERPAVHFKFEPDQLFYTSTALDYSVVKVADRSIDGTRQLSEWGWHVLSGEAGKGDPGEYLTIIQHPAGELKQVCVRENKLLKYLSDTVWYMTDTLAGSSGSPAFNRFWQVLALHHSGVPKKDSHGRILTRDGKVWDESMDESLIAWVANEGIRISSIVSDLEANMAHHPLIQAALSAQPSPRESIVRMSPAARPASAPLGFWIEQSPTGASLVVPLSVPAELVKSALPAVAVANAGGNAYVNGYASSSVADIGRPPGPIHMPAFQTGLPIEAVHIDQTTLNLRPGYKPTFLGSGSLTVPLPKLSESLKAKAAALKDKPTQVELKYFNYSVVMNKDRKLAFFSAVNIDGAQQQDVGKREGDSWLRDPRIDEAAQIGDEFYSKQSTLEADRSRNPFDRGHLVRRLDATWGKTVSDAKAHGDDSFHFTNSTPQFWSFNQGKLLWAGLEDYTRDIVLKDKSRMIVVNGPIFDGPDAPVGSLPRPSDPPHQDPAFGGIRIPKYFWKLMVVVRAGKLAATGFVMSQRDQILGIDRIEEAAIFEALSTAQVKVFQVSLADLSAFTGLDFGPLVQVDTHESTGVGPRAIESFDDIRF